MSLWFMLDIHNSTGNSQLLITYIMISQNYDVIISKMETVVCMAFISKLVSFYLID